MQREKMKDNYMAENECASEKTCKCKGKCQGIIQKQEHFPVNIHAEMKRHKREKDMQGGKHARRKTSCNGKANKRIKG